MRPYNQTTHWLTSLSDSDRQAQQEAKKQTNMVKLTVVVVYGLNQT
jgi:hypothetical protein